MNRITIGKCQRMLSDRAFLKWSERFDVQLQALVARYARRSDVEPAFPKSPIELCFCARPTELQTGRIYLYFDVEGHSLHDQYMGMPEEGAPLRASVEILTKGEPVCCYGPIELRVQGRRPAQTWNEFADVLAFHSVLLVTRLLSRKGRGFDCTAVPSKVYRRTGLIRSFYVRGVNAVRNRVLRSSSRSFWALAIGKPLPILHKEAVAPAIRDYQWIMPDTDRFWADPFLLEQDGSCCLYYEELRYQENVGRLFCRQVVPQDGRIDLGEPTLLSFEPPITSHLSFPFVFKHEGLAYLLPENGESGRTSLYVSDRFPDRWKLRAHLLPDIAGIDPVLFFRDGVFWLFVSDRVSGNSENHLLLYSSNRIDGKYQEHPCSPISLGLNGSRMAGPILEKDGKIFRMGQDCTVRYGRALRVFEISVLNEHEYSETEVSSLEPVHHSDAVIGIHTYAELAEHDLAVIDALGP